MVVNNRRSGVWTPRMGDQRLQTSWFQPDSNAILESEKLLASAHFLVRQGDEFGERLRCTICQNRHDYVTLLCIPKPITGLANGLYVYYRAIKETSVLKSMSPETKARFDQIEQVLNQMPDLSTTHPQLARKLVQDIGPRDAQIGAVSLGILEGISPTEARKLAQSINDRGIRPPFKLDTASQAEKDRMSSYSRPDYEKGSRW